MIIKNFIYKLPRYFLAIIGLAIGVASVIGMSSLGIAGKIKLINELKKRGVDLLFIYPERVKFNPAYPNRIGEYKSLKSRDLFFIKSFFFNIKEAVPVKYTFSSCKYRDQLMDGVRIVGTNLDYLDINDYSLYLGNIKNFSKGAFIGYSLYKNIFNLNNPIGKYLNINGKFIKIFGVLSQKGVSDSGEDEDKIVIVPVRLFKKKFNNEDYFNIIYIKPEKISYQSVLKKNLNILLMKLHNLIEYPMKQKDFTIKSMEYYLQRKVKIANLMSISTLIVSSISLLVGGIGVMAILIIIAIEETREIGVKRAFGATRLNIFMEFIFRSFLIAFTGSFLGLILGFLITFIIETYQHIENLFPIVYAFLGIVASFLVSFIFGLFPAIKASKIPPVEALRYE